MNEQEKQEEMQELEKQIKDCKKCELHKIRTNALCGEGSLNAEILFIGEAPGYNEDLKGKHFIGRAGKIFDEFLDSIKLSREKIYITNVLKCKIPKNERPKQEYIEKCTPYLNEQIKIIKPKIIVPLGRFATNYIFERYKIKQQPIQKIHGKVFLIKNLFEEVKIIPQLHPAVTVYNFESMETLKEDFAKIKNTL